MDTIMDVNAEVLEKIFNQEEVPVIVIVLKRFEIDTYVKGHHEYKDIGTPEIGESLDGQIEPNNPAEKYVVCIRKSGKVVGHLKKGATDRFVEIIFFFVKGDPYSKTKTITTGR